MGQDQDNTYVLFVRSAVSINQLFISEMGGDDICLTEFALYEAI